MRFITNPKFAGILAILLIVLLWFGVAAWIHQPLLLPAPDTTLWQMGALIGTADFWTHLGATMSRGLIGFGFALILSAILCIPAGTSRFWEGFLRPLIVVLRSTPSMALILLALIWMKGDLVPVFVTFWVVFPLMLQNLIDGLHGIDWELEEMTVVYRLTGLRRFTSFYLPSLFPALAAAMANGLGFTWKVLIAAEVLAYPHWGVGTQMDAARTYLQTEKVFAWTLIVTFIGLLFDSGLSILLRGLPAAGKGCEALHE